jgi:hypothetical protein
MDDPFDLMMGLFVLLVVVAVLSSTGSDGKLNRKKGRVA